MVVERRPVAGPHSAHKCAGWGPAHSPWPQAGPGSTAAQLHNPVDSCCLGMAFTVSSCHEEPLQATCGVEWKEHKCRSFIDGVYDI